MTYKIYKICVYVAFCKTLNYLDVVVKLDSIYYFSKSYDFSLAENSVCQHQNIQLLRQNTLYQSISILLHSGKTLQSCHSDTSGSSDYGTHSTHSLGHMRASLTALKPQTDKAGPTSRGRDTNTHSE